MKWGYIALGASSLACFPVSNVCKQTQVPLTQPDGGAFRCTVADDCPRQANVFVCIHDGLPDKECVSCDNTNCVDHQPVPCQ